MKNVIAMGDLIRARSAPVAPHNEGQPSLAWGFTSGLEPPQLGAPGRAPRAPWKIPGGDIYRPDMVLDAAVIGDVETRAISARGTMHRVAGTVRQDALALQRSVQGAWLVAVVCDGLSSASQSHRAADIAANAATRHLAAHLDESTDDGVGRVEEAIRCASDEVSSVAQETKRSEADLLTTITVLAMAGSAEAQGHR